MDQLDRQGGNSGAVAQANELVAQAQEHVQETVDDLGEKAGARVRAEIDGRSTQIAEHLASMSRALHRAGESLRDEDKVSSAGRTDQAPASLSG